MPIASYGKRHIGYNPTMDKNLLLGMWRYLLPVPPKIWRGQVQRSAEGGIQAIQFLSEDHHRVRDLVVRELPRYGKPIPPQWIVGQLGLPLERVSAILDELERGMTFLFRNPLGEVAWAYPVTVDETPHKVAFSSGEKLYAA
jgi:hypothetical protein